MSAAYRRRWWHNLFFEFWLEIPLFSIRTRLFREAVERLTYDICRVRIELTRPHIWRMKRKVYSVEFQLYKRQWP